MASTPRTTTPATITPDGMQWIVLMDVSPSTATEPQWDIYQTADNEAEAITAADRAEREGGRMCLAVLAGMDDEGNLLVPNPSAD